MLINNAAFQSIILMRRHRLFKIEMLHAKLKMLNGRINKQKKNDKAEPLSICCFFLIIKF